MSQKMSDLINEAVAADLRRDWWYKKGEATFNPTLPDMRKPEAIEDYILSGWMPEEPFITPRDKVTFIGCCFGTSLLNHMKTLDYADPGEIDTTFIPISETLATSFAMRQMFEWEFDGVKPSLEALKGNRAMEINFTDSLWKGTLQRLSETDVFILQVSSAEVWYDEPTGAVVWRETPGANPQRQKFRMSTAEENRANFLTIHDIVRRHRPHAKIILMLSPIPMIATYRPQSCITATTVSKAAVRVAMDEAWREVGHEGRLLYCPFYEVIMDGFGASPYGGHFNGDRRHINDTALDYLLRLFEAHYCKVRTLSRPIIEAYVDAKVSAIELPQELIAAAERGDRRAIQKLIDQYEGNDDEPAADLVAAYAAQRFKSESPQTASATLVEHDWSKRDLVWQVCSNGEPIGAAPQTMSVPAQAWAYGVRSEAVEAEGDDDLWVRVRLEAVTGQIGVLLTRPDGSSLSGVDRVVRPEEGLRSVDLLLHGDDGPGHVILRNCDPEGSPGSVRVLDITVKPVAVTAPARRLLPA